MSHSYADVLKPKIYSIKIPPYSTQYFHNQSLHIVCLINIKAFSTINSFYTLYFEFNYKYLFQYYFINSTNKCPYYTLQETVF